MALNLFIDTNISEPSHKRAEDGYEEDDLPF